MRPVVIAPLPPHGERPLRVHHRHGLPRPRPPAGRLATGRPRAAPQPPLPWIATSIVLTFSWIALKVRPSRPERRTNVPRGVRIVLCRVTRRSGSGNGSGLIRSAFTTVKIAVLTPIATASVISAIAVKPGVLRSMRSA